MVLAPLVMPSVLHMHYVCVTGGSVSDHWRAPVGVSAARLPPKGRDNEGAKRDDAF